MKEMKNIKKQVLEKLVEHLSSMEDPLEGMLGKPKAEVEVVKIEAEKGEDDAKEEESKEKANEEELLKKKKLGL
jgi:hypothetical protein